MVVAVNLNAGFAVHHNVKSKADCREVNGGGHRAQGGKQNSKKGGTMIDSNPNEFAGTTPVTDGLANWNWLKERLQTAQLDRLDDWLEEELLGLEADYAGWVTGKSRQLALQNELRSSRS